MSAHQYKWAAAMNERRDKCPMSDRYNCPCLQLLEFFGCGATVAHNEVPLSDCFSLYKLLSNAPA